MYKFKGCLFDLDGTLINSIESVNRSWTQVASKYSLDLNHVLHVIHGRPANECLRELLSAHSEKTIMQEIQWLKYQEANDTEGVVAIPGAVEFLAQLEYNKIPWGIVTSCNQQVAKARMLAAGVPTPDLVITFEDVERGKPAPDPYLIGASRLGLPTNQCLVFEDAIAGVNAAKSAGSKVFGILSHSSLQQLGIEIGAKNYLHLGISPLQNQQWQIMM